jgi:hypothetical protein
LVLKSPDSTFIFRISIQVANLSALCRYGENPSEIDHRVQTPSHAINGGLVESEDQLEQDGGGVFSGVQQVEKLGEQGLVVHRVVVGEDEKKEEGGEWIAVAF